MCFSGFDQHEHIGICPMVRNQVDIVDEEIVRCGSPVGNYIWRTSSPI